MMTDLTKSCILIPLKLAMISAQDHRITKQKNKKTNQKKKKKSVNYLIVRVHEDAQTFSWSILYRRYLQSSLVA